LGGTDDPGGPGSGGGIYSSGETLNIVNSTVANNLVLGGRAGSGLAGLGGGYGLGGGIFNGNGNLIVTNSTISDNSATGGESSGSASTGIGSGGGIYNPADATAKSTIIAENASSDNDPDAFGTFASQGFNLIGKSDGATGFNQATDLKGTVASPLDPKLDPNGLQNNGGPTQTIALESGSPAIDQGTSSGLTGSLTTDQRGTGFPRTADYSNFANAAGGDGTDIGAFEFWTLKITSITRLANGYIRLQGLGVPNAVHTLHSSPDLSPNSFGAITTVNANGIGALQYDDAGAVGLTKRFYRLAFP
jgi:hypothetical protein